MARIFKEAKRARAAHLLWAIGRLKENTTLAQARADFEAINEELRTQYSTTNSAVGVRLIPYLDSVVNDYSASLWLLEGAVGCLLLITCANVGNLLMIRMQERRRELSIRAALGASRTQLILQSLVETSAVALIGGALGLPLAAWAVDLIKSISPDDITRFQEVGLDYGSLGFVLAIMICTTLLAGLVPAWFSSDADPAPALTAGGERSWTPGPLRQKRQGALVVSQVALSFLLLTAAGLLARSYQALQDRPLGFHTDHILTADIYLPNSRYSTPAKCTAAWSRILEKLRSVPGVTGVALNDDMPFKTIDRITFWVSGQPDPEIGKAPLSVKQSISPGYFSVLGVPVLRGRAFTEADQADGERVVIINQALAQRFFPGQDPLGKQLNDLGDKFGGRRNQYTIVGVVPDVEHNSPETQLQLFHAYYPYTRDPWGLSLDNAMTLVFSVNADPNSLVPAIRKAVAAIDPDTPILRVNTFDDYLAKYFTFRQLTTMIVSVFAGVAMLLAAVGLYAVISYSVAQRTREIGVRTALGAPSASILIMVIRTGLGIACAGLVVGGVIASILTPLITSLLYGVSSSDPLTFGIAIIALGMAALLACLIPALRATSINPITALRE